jgi:hypothetical protein
MPRASESWFSQLPRYHVGTNLGYEIEDTCQVGWDAAMTSVLHSVLFLSREVFLLDMTTDP